MESLVCFSSGCLFGTLEVFFEVGHCMIITCDDLQLNMFRLLPTRGLSRSWGYLTNLELPLFLRQPLLGLYVWLFDCQMEEAVVEDLRSYKSLVQLFTRRLKEGTRPISSLSELVSIYLWGDSGSRFINYT